MPTKTGTPFGIRKKLDSESWNEYHLYLKHKFKTLSYPSGSPRVRRRYLGHHEEESFLESKRFRFIPIFKPELIDLVKIYQEIFNLMYGKMEGIIRPHNKDKWLLWWNSCHKEF